MRRCVLGSNGRRSPQKCNGSESHASTCDVLLSEGNMTSLLIVTSAGVSTPPHHGFKYLLDFRVLIARSRRWQWRCKQQHGRASGNVSATFSRRSTVMLHAGVASLSFNAACTRATQQHELPVSYQMPARSPSSGDYLLRIPWAPSSLATGRPTKPVRFSCECGSP